MRVTVRHEPHQGETYRHEHIFNEIAFIVAGTAEHVTVAGSRRLYPGDVIVIRPRMWHQYVQTSSFALINCLFDGSMLRHGDERVLQAPMLFALFRQRVPQAQMIAPLLLHASPAQQERLTGCLDIMRDELTEQTRGWKPALTVALMDFLVSIARLDNSPNTRTAHKGTRAHKAVMEVVNYLETHFTAPPVLGALAKMVHLSPAYLCRTFTRQMGMSIVAYLHHMRIEEACRLLRHTNRSITEVAGQVGYNEIAYFSRRFRAEMGRSPRQYRNADGLQG